MQLTHFAIAAFLTLAGSAMAAPTAENVHTTRSLIMARDVLDRIIEGRSLEIRAWTRAQEAQLVAAAAQLAAVTARRAHESTMTPAQKTQLRNDLAAAQAAHNNLLRLKKEG